MNAILLKRLSFSTLLLSLALLPALSEAKTFASFKAIEDGDTFSFRSLNSDKATFFTTSSNAKFQFTQYSKGFNSFYSEQHSTLTFSGSTMTHAVQVSGTNAITQAVDKMFRMAFVSDTNKNLLTMVVTNTDLTNPALFTGQNGNDVLTLSAGEPNQSVVFTSDFLTFNPMSKDSASVSLLLEAGLAIGSNGFLADFDANETGLFGSTLMPTQTENVTPMVAVPEPGNMALLLGGVGLMGVVMRRRRPVAR